MNEVIKQNLWIFELGSKKTLMFLLRIILGFQQRDRQNSRNLKNDTFCRLPVTSVQCIFGTKNYHASKISRNYDDEDCSQGYGQIKEGFKALMRTTSFNHIYQTMILDFQI